jgi:hypothetical protein
MKTSNIDLTNSIYPAIGCRLLMSLTLAWFEASQLICPV